MLKCQLILFFSEFFMKELLVLFVFSFSIFLKIYPFIVLEGILTILLKLPDLSKIFPFFILFLIFFSAFELKIDS